MVEKVIGKTGEEMPDEAQYRAALRRMQSGDEKAKTKVAFYKLTGVGGVGVDEEGAVVLLEERARDGDDEAKWMLGLCCEYGIGVQQDIERAELLYRQSWGGGNVVGEFLFQNGRGGRGSKMMSVRCL